jgi:hypothetical protein
MKIPGVVAIAFAATSIVPVAWAQGDGSVVSISGFGTLGAVYHDLEGVEFRRDISQPSGAKAQQLSLDNDSMLGLQLTARPSAQLEATVQLVSRHAIDGYSPQVSWAYAKYKPVEGVAIRAGRLGLEMYMQGDSAEIGYANLLVRQPMVFYPRTMDGLDAELVRPLADGTLRLKGMVGSVLGKLLTTGDPYDAEGSKMWGALAEYAQGSWVGRVSTGQLTLKREVSDSQLEALRGALSMTPNGAKIIDTISMENRPITYTSVALAYDSGPLQSVVSYVRASTPNWQDQQVFSSQVGYRIGNFTPYAAYSVTQTDRAIVSTGIPWGLSLATDTLNQGSEQAQAALKNNQSDFGIGVRYDISRNTSIKFQADRILYQDPGSLAGGITDNSLLSSDYQSRGNRALSLFSVALEFTF